MLCGCASAFKVSQAASAGGLPFYTKAMIYRQHSTYEYAWIRVSLSTAPVVGEDKGEEKLGARTTFVREIADIPENRARVARLQALVSDFPGAPLDSLSDRLVAIRSVLDSIAPLPSTHRTKPTAADLRLTGNFVERVAIVDYTKTYYLNARVPFFGSSNLSAEVAADGTLSKGANAAVGGGADALSAVTTAVTGITPIREYLSSKWIPTRADSTALASEKKFLAASVRTLAGPRTKAFRVDVAVEPQVQLFDFTNDMSAAPSGGTLTPVKADFMNGTFTTLPTEKPAAKATDDAISFSGKVQLPPAKAP
jgi:hypothetical protein